MRRVQRSGFSRRDFLRLSAGALGGLLAAQWPGLARLHAQDIVAATNDNLVYSGPLPFWDWTFEPRGAFMQSLIARWQDANPGISTGYTTYDYSDLQTRLLTAASAGTNPPLANVHVNWRYELQRAGALAPYPADLFDFDALISTPFNRDADGNVYTTTFNYYGDVLFYNIDLLAEAGYTPDDIPANWDDFLRFARELTLRDARGFVSRPGCALNHYYSQEWLWTSLVYQQGAFLYSAEGDLAEWDNEAGVRALDIIRGWYNYEPIDDPNLLRHFEQFGSGQAVMFISHGYWAPDLPLTYPEINWGVKPIPTFSGNGLPSWGMALPEEGLAVFSNASPAAQDAAFSLIRYALGPAEHRARWAEIMDGPPDLLTLLDNDALLSSSPVIAALAETLPYRVIYGERPLEAEALWRTMFEEVILNNTPLRTHSPPPPAR